MILGKNMSYIVRKKEDLHRRKVGEKISINEDGEVGVLKFKSQQGNNYLGHKSNLIWVALQIQDRYGKLLNYLAYHDGIKKIPYIN